MLCCSTRPSRILFRSGLLNRRALYGWSLLFLLLLLASWGARAQVQLQKESFETDGEGTRYISNYTILPNTVPAGAPTRNQYFFRASEASMCNGTTTPCTGNLADHRGTHTAGGTLDGTYYWAGEGVRGATPVAPAAPDRQPGTVTLNSINTTGYRNLQVKVGLQDGRYSATSQNWEPNDTLKVQVRFNGTGPWVTVGQFTSDASVLIQTGPDVYAGQLRQDVNLNGTATTADPLVTATMQDFTFDLPSTATTLQTRFVVSQAGLSEEFSFDNIRVLGTPTANAAPVLANIESTIKNYPTANAAVQITNTITLADADNPTQTSAIVRITAGWDPANDVLAFAGTAATGNINGTYSPSTGVLTLTSTGSTATLGQWQAALRLVTFQTNTALPSGSQDRAVLFATTDPSGTQSNAAFRTVGYSPAVAPTVSTAAPGSVTTTSAVLGGNVTADGGDNVTERGVVYSTSNNTPTTADAKATNGTGIGTFSATISTLMPGTTYYVRAYAVNSAGTSYGSSISFTTTPNAPVVVSPANGSLLSTDTPTYSGTAPASSTVTVFVDGSSISTTTATGGSWSLAQPTALSQGNHTVYATAQVTGSVASANSTTNTFSIDTVRPSVAISSGTAPNGGSSSSAPFAYTVIFSESVTGFVTGDLSVSNGTITGFSGSGTTYSFNVTPLANGAVVVNVPANVAQDAAANFNTAAGPYTITYSQPVTAAPVVVSPANGSLLNTDTPTYAGTAPVSSTVTVFVDGSSIGTTTATGGNWSLAQSAALTQGSHTVYATAQVPGSAVSANANTNTFSVDSVRPTVSIGSTAGASGSSTTVSPIPFTVTFSEGVTGFVTGDLTVSNGTISGFSGTGASYTFNVTPTTSGAVIVNLSANVAQDAAGNGNTAASSPYTIIYSATPTIAGFAAGPASVCVGSLLTFTATVGNLSGSDAYTLTNGSSVRTGTLTSSAFQETLTSNGMGGQSFTLTVSSGGQRAMSTTPVTVNALPVATLTNDGPLSCTMTSVTLTATGGSTYQFSAGATQLNGSNTASVNTAGLYSVTVTGANGCSATASTSLQSSTATVTITTPTVSTATVGVSFSQSFTALGGSSPYSYSLASGSLPAGLNLAVTGVVSGTPTRSGSFTFSARAYDATGCSGVSAAYVLTVIDATPTITGFSANPAALCVGSPVTFMATIGNLMGSYSYTLTNGSSTQTGTSTSTTFSQSVTASGSGTQTFTLTVSANGQSAASVTALTVNPLPPAPTLTGVSRTVNASNTPLSLGQFVSAPGTLSFSGVSGAITNPPTATISTGGVQNFSVTQTNGNGCVSAATPFMLTVVATPTSQSVCRSSTVVLNAITTGTRYEWYKNGQSAPFKLTEIASIQKGTTTSSLTIVSAQTTATYYCKVFQTDGSFSFAGPFVVTVNYGCTAPSARQAALDGSAPVEWTETGLQIRLLPNPLTDGRLRAVVQGAEGQPLMVELLDLRGRQLHQQQWAGAAPAQAVDWDVSAQPAGAYLLRAVSQQASGTTQSQTLKVLKTD